MVKATWNWVHTPEAYAGLPTKQHAERILRLKGSTASTDKLILGATATLFKRFAQDWEAEQILAAQPIPWNTKNKPKRAPPEPLHDTDSEDSDPDQEHKEEQLDSDSEWESEEEATQSIAAAMEKSSQQLQKAMAMLQPANGSTHRHKSVWTIEDTSEG